MSSQDPTESEPVTAGTGRPRQIRQPVLRMLLLLTGWLSVLLGVIGIFLPLLPTTPFLLLAAACFVRTSERFYQWLVQHPWFGPYLIGYLNGKGLPRKAKFYTLLMMWSGLLLSGFVMLDSLYVRVLFPLIGLGVTVYIWRLPTLKVQ